MNIIVVTGASSGIGKEFERQIDRHFKSVDEIWLIARREERLRKLSASCRHSCRIFAIDLLKESDVSLFCEQLRNYNPKITMLINSAGFGILGAFTKLPIDEQLNMINLNCRALTRITYECIPFMDQDSRVIQLASSAAFLPQINFAVYAATKSYVLSFSRALNEELRNKGIHITAVCPGPVDTEFFERAEKGQGRLMLKNYVMVQPQKVVKKALEDSRNKKEISVCGIPMKLFLIGCKILPHSLFLRIMRFLK